MTQKNGYNHEKIRRKLDISHFFRRNLPFHNLRFCVLLGIPNKIKPTCEAQAGFEKWIRFVLFLLLREKSDQRRKLFIR